MSMRKCLHWVCLVRSSDCHFAQQLPRNLRERLVVSLCGIANEELALESGASGLGTAKKHRLSKELDPLIDKAEENYNEMRDTMLGTGLSGRDSLQRAPGPPASATSAGSLTSSAV